MVRIYLATLSSHLSLHAEIAEHEEMGIRLILFIDELSRITVGGYRGDGSGM